MRIAILSVLSIWLVGCLPDPLPVGRIPQLEPKIVISSQVLPDQSVLILLTKSFGALDASSDSDPVELLNQIAINDALVILEGGNFIDTLTLIQNGVYGSSSVPFLEESFYTLRVESPGMGSITATAQVKQQVQFESLQAEIYDTGYDTLATIIYSFQDLPGRNYYMINVQHISIEEDPEPSQFLNPRVFTYLKESPSIDAGLVDDTFDVRFPRDFIPGDTIMVQLANISKEYYDFLYLRRDSRYNFSDFLGEPLNYPTNVKGGLGWFTLQLPDVRFITVEQE